MISAELTSPLRVGLNVEPEVRPTLTRSDIAFGCLTEQIQRQKSHPEQPYPDSLLALIVTSVEPAGYVQILTILESKGKASKDQAIALREQITANPKEAPYLAWRAYLEERLAQYHDNPTLYAITENDFRVLNFYPTKQLTEHFPQDFPAVKQLREEITSAFRPAMSVSHLLEEVERSLTLGRIRLTQVLGEVMRKKEERMEAGERKYIRLAISASDLIFEVERAAGEPGKMKAIVADVEKRVADRKEKQTREKAERKAATTPRILHAKQEALYQRYLAQLLRLKGPAVMAIAAYALATSPITKPYVIDFPLGVLDATWSQGVRPMFMDKLHLPPTTELAEQTRANQPVTIEDSTGTPITVRFAPEGGLKNYVSIDGISQYMIAYAVGNEDPTFYTNAGYNVPDIIKAFFGKITPSQIKSIMPFIREGGASTITQQVARNLLFSPEYARTESLPRKVKEWLLADEITRNYPKNKILEMYLNVIYLGNQCNGVPAAAQIYFGKDAKDLDRAQSLLLTAMIQSPTTYDPTTSEGKIALLNHAKDVLDNLIKKGAVNPDEKSEILKELDQVKILTPEVPQERNFYNGMVFGELEKMFGKNLPNYSVEVQTTLEAGIQKVAVEEAAKLKGTNSIAVLDIIDKEKASLVSAMAGNISPADLLIETEKGRFSMLDLMTAFSIDLGGRHLEPTVIKSIKVDGQEVCSTKGAIGTSGFCPGLTLTPADFQGGTEIPDLGYQADISHFMVNGKLFHLLRAKAGTDEKSSIIAILTDADEKEALKTLDKLVKSRAKYLSGAAYYGEQPVSTRLQSVHPVTLTQSAGGEVRPVGWKEYQEKQGAGIRAESRAVSNAKRNEMIRGQKAVRAGLRRAQARQTGVRI